MESAVPPVSSRAKSPLPSSNLEIMVYQNLVVVQDLVPLIDLPEGYLLARSGGLILNSQTCDVAAGYATKLSNPPSGYYSLPVLHAKKTKGAIRRAIEKELERTHHSRHLVYTGNDPLPSLYDLLKVEDVWELRPVAYHHVTSTELQEQGAAGKQVLDHIQRIIQLCHQA